MAGPRPWFPARLIPKLCTENNVANKDYYLNPGMTADTEFGIERRGFWPHQTDEPDQFRRTYQDLRDFFQAHGPFFGLMGFSEGASVAATVLIQDMRQHGGSLGIKCGIFFCGVPPLDLGLERGSNSGNCGEIRPFEETVDGVLLRLPTAHVWSRSGDVHPGMGQGLVALCEKGVREEVPHDLGHDIPGAQSNVAWKETIRAIERTIERARVVEYR